MKIRKIGGITPDNTKSLDEAFASVAPEKVACCNWPEDFPYSPDMTFRMFHTGSHLFIRYEVAENYTAALVTEDGGEVWTDSCAECFIALDGNSYYNLEATCIGRILFNNRKSRNENLVIGPAEALESIIRIPSLGIEPFEERIGDNRWALTLAVPAKALFRHDIDDWSGLNVRMNVYKCGDNLSKPHFLSWQPISVPSPDFHRPEFFTEVEFEA